MTVTVFPVGTAAGAVNVVATPLVVWAGEFGRTPHAQGGDGRDHNNKAFTVWMAGGGVKGGMSYGQTDEYGYEAVENKVQGAPIGTIPVDSLFSPIRKVNYQVTNARVGQRGHHVHANTGQC